jgi:hypothetical protein
MWGSGCGGAGRQSTAKPAIGTVGAPAFVINAAKHRAAFATFGESAGRAERAAIVRELHNYYGAVAEGHFEHGCSLLSQKDRARVANTQSMDGGSIEHRCGGRLGEVLTRTSAKGSERLQFTVASVKEVRLKGNEGYVVFTTVARPATQEALSVIREGGSWRIAVGIALPISFTTPAALVQ